MSQDDKPNRGYPIVTLDADEILYRRGDVGNCMYLIQDGTVEMVRDPTVRAPPAAVFERGDFFGEMAILCDERRNYAARARTDCRLVEIDGKLFLKLLRRNPDIAVRMTRKLSRRLSDTKTGLYETWQRAHEEAAAEEEAAPIRLVHLDDNAPTPTVFLIPDGSVLTVGRIDPHNQIAPDIDLTDIDPHFSTSRRHARLLRRGEHVLLVEERATNGTFVDGKRLTRDEPEPLHGGEELRFGGVRLQFRID